MHKSVNMNIFIENKIKIMYSVVHMSEFEDYTLKST